MLDEPLGFDICVYLCSSVVPSFYHPGLGVRTTFFSAVARTSDSHT